MAVREITYEERNVMYDKALETMGIERRRPSREELEKEIIDYLGKKQPCTLATCGNDGWPRVSVVDYVNDGLTIYIFSEGGDKFKNLEENNRVGIGIGTGSKAMKTRGINIGGIAEVYDDESPEFAGGLEIIRPIIADIEKATGRAFTFPKGILRLIRVRPVRMVYHHTIKGIKHAVWEAQ
jgi:hypothetical protein